jgi:hypothetical protein
LVRLALVVVTAACAIAANGSVAHAHAGDDPRGPEPPVMIVMPPPPEAAAPDPEPPPPPPVEEKLDDGGGALTLGTLFFRPSLAHTTFEGSGTPLGGNRRETFRHQGRALGLEAPLMWGSEFAFHYMRRYFAVGITGFVAGNPGRTDSKTSPAYSPAADQVNPGSLFGYGAGLDLAGALPLGPVAFRAGGVLGLRGFSMPMTGFEKKTCRSKRGTYPCNEDATTGATLFFEPRVRIEITPAARNPFFFGGYVGMDVLGGTGPTMGLFLGFHTPHATLQP